MVMPVPCEKVQVCKPRNRGLHVKLGQTASLDDGSWSPCNSKESGSLRTLANPVCFHTLLLRNRSVNENLPQNIPPNRTLLPYLHSLINRGGFWSRTRFLSRIWSRNCLWLSSAALHLMGTAFHLRSHLSAVSRGIAIHYHLPVPQFWATAARVWQTPGSLLLLPAASSFALAKMFVSAFLMSVGSLPVCSTAFGEVNQARCKCQCCF